MTRTYHPASSLVWSTTYKGRVDQVEFVPNTFAVNLGQQFGLNNYQSLLIAH
jgi:hypothetical protein